jgi:GT2 family glycosyltransferase
LSSITATRNAAAATVLSADHSAVILLNYQNAPDTLACLCALAAMPLQPGRIIVVDNNSADGSVERIMEGWRPFTAPVLLREAEAVLPSPPSSLRHGVLALSANGGFAAGNNAGIRLALQDPNCAAVWLLNNDTEPAPDALEKLCARLSLSPAAGPAGSTLVYAHDRQTAQCAGGAFLSPWTGAAKYVHGGERLQDVLAADTGQAEAALSYVTGASLLVRRAVIDAVGLLPEAYFMYYEDADYGLLCGRAGFFPVWARESVVYHREGGSSGAEGAAGGGTRSRPEWVDYLGLRNRVYMMRKHYPWALPVVLLGCLGAMLRRIRRGQADRIPLVCRAVRDGLHGRMGRPEALFPALRERS